MAGGRGGYKVIMVSGYYGFDNLGDEAILAALCTDLVALGFKRQDLRVLSAQPRETAALHGVQALPRYDLKKIWRTLGSTRCLISGGGSLLQDVTSKRSIPYYLGIVELAMLRKVPVVMYGQGVGPVQSSFFHPWVKRAFLQSAASSVRDQASAQFLTELGVPQGKVQMCADPVFQKKMVANTSPDNSRLLLNLRPYDRWEEQKGLWLEFLAQWQREGFRVEFVPLGPGDKEIGQILQREIPDLQVHPTLTLASCTKVFTGAGLCISMRLHGVIFSALHDVLPLGLNYDPKVGAICQQLRVPFWELEALPSLAPGLSQVLGKAGRHRLDYQQALGELREGALANRTMLAQILGQVEV